ncbi:HAMP domain-containing sensor histidine kinase [Streptomyces canus]|uniref:HAMP domain-containing sensor histidine kinase n=1 Tax=Streptomyces canus TaxID=58343 RepID=UPI002F90E2C5
MKLTDGLNRLQHLLKAQQAFASEASPQLKIPLPALRLRLRLRLRLENFEPYLDPHAHPSLDEAVGEIERLARMVHGLLALARLENAATTLEPVDLDAVLTERVAIWEPLAAEQYVAIDITGPPADRVWAILGALLHIIDNLLAKALRVSPPSTTITLHRVPGTGLDARVRLRPFTPRQRNPRSGRGGPRSPHPPAAEPSWLAGGEVVTQPREADWAW